MPKSNIAILVYGESGSERNALHEDKFREFAEALLKHGFAVESVLYNDESADRLATELLKFNAVLVWVNPIEQGKDRTKLDALLRDLAAKGYFVSSHPDIILKLGTKEILHSTRQMEWGEDVKIHQSFETFKNEFPSTLQQHKKRVLKQYRSNGGNGVFKVVYNDADPNCLHVVHAKGNEQTTLSLDEFFAYFEPFFQKDGLLIEQPLNENIANGMVRCYLSGTKVAGFGYQEINALYEGNDGNYLPPSKRYYFTSHCGLFQDMKERMENIWVPQLQEQFSIATDELPIIWDADFFINDMNDYKPGKYTLCEINLSSVAPFPPSAIPFMIEELQQRIKK